MTIGMLICNYNQKIEKMVLLIFDDFYVIRYA